MDSELGTMATIAGTVAGVLSIGAFLPQAYRIIQRRSAEDVSLSMYVTIIVSCVLWMFYAHVRGSRELFATNLVIAMIAAVIAFLRIRYRRR
jgi:MtN3 and saliva related transmembrane protein